MRPFSRIESPKPSSQPYPLDPVLQVALSNLDIQLEQELARYRRSRIAMAPSPRGRRRSGRQAVNLLSVGPAAAPTASSATGLATLQLSSPPSEQPQVYQDAASPIDRTGDRPDQLSVLDQDRDHMGASMSMSEAESSLMWHPSNNHGELPSHPSVDELVGKAGEALDDYLESSEELLKSLSEEESALQTEQTFMKSLLTPLGLGSMLLLLVSSAMFGYVLMNPTIFSRLLAFRNPLVGVSPQPSVAVPESAESASATAPVPNLASREFQDLSLNSLGTLSAGPTAGTARSIPLDPSSTALQSLVGSTTAGATGTAAIAPATSATTPSSVSAATMASPVVPAKPAVAPVSRPIAPPVQAPVEPPAAPRQAYQPPVTRSAPAAPVATAPAPRKKVQPPAAPVVVPAKPSQTVSSPSTTASAEARRYKVVTNFEGDRSLESARQSVPDAYVRNFPDGAKVQLGAYSDQKAAEAQAEALRQQGIQAEVYQP